MRRRGKCLALALWTLAWMLAPSGQARAASPAAAPIPSAAVPVPSAAAVPSADTQTEALLNFLKSRNYAGAFKLFDANMKAQVSEEQLKGLWEGQLAPLGSLVSWTMAAVPQQQGYDVRVGTLKFQNGGLLGTVAVDPKTGLISGFYVKPITPPQAATMAAYVDTSRFHSVQVRVGKDPFVLGGTLTIPTGKGPFPAAILVHGSGPQDRDETIGANKVFRDIAEGLSSKGIVVLRYDKRTLRYGAQMKGPVTIDDEVIEDALAGIDLLRATPSVDAQRVYVIGHSLGALLAPEIAIRAATAAGSALLAPPGRPPWDIILAQMRYLGSSEQEIADTERKIALMKAGKLGDEKLLGATGSYWRDWASRDGIAMAKKLGRPILILHGDRDFQVAEEDIAAWRTGLLGTPNVEIVSLPGLSHLFIKGEGKPSPSEYDIPGHVDAGVIDRLHNFIAPQKAPAAK